MSKNAKKFICEKCDFKCSKMSDYKRHILTAKHQILTDTYIKTAENAKAFKCECGNEYKHRQSLNNHKHKCTYNPEQNATLNTIEITDELTSQPGIHSMIGTLVKENQDFKKLLIEQSSQMMELAKNSQVVNNTTNNTNNNQFNLNFFLNDTCKDAMNITDFLGNMDVHIDELEYIGNHGYVNGMTKMIMERLKVMDITKRPIHCTDVKRETMYIKDKDEWCKDTDELVKLRRILSSISMTNYRSVANWRQAHPKSEIMDSREYNFCYKMMRAILGDAEDEQIRLDNKIIKTFAKDLFVNKNIK